MGFCTQRYFLLSICLLQMVSIVQRQVFDFLGYLWIPILVNFFEIIFIIFGFFGAFQYRPKYIILYSVWHLFWLGWNIFLICLYLDVGVLNHKESKVLKLDPGSGTWWVNGPGCQVTFNTTTFVPVYENVTNCLVNYRYVEVFQAGLQCVLAFFGALTGFSLSRSLAEEDDSFNYMGGDGKNPQHLSLKPMYVTTDSYLLYPTHRSTAKTDTLTSIDSGYFRPTKIKTNKVVHSDLIRTQNPVFRSSSFDVLNNTKRKTKYNRPKSLYANPLDY